MLKRRTGGPESFKTYQRYCTYGRIIYLYICVLAMLQSFYEYPCTCNDQFNDLPIFTFTFQLGASSIMITEDGQQRDILRGHSSDYFLSCPDNVLERMHESDMERLLFDMVQVSSLGRRLCMVQTKTFLRYTRLCKPLFLWS